MHVKMTKNRNQFMHLCCLTCDFVLSFSYEFAFYTELTMLCIVNEQTSVDILCVQMHKYQNPGCTNTHTHLPKIEAITPYDFFRRRNRILLLRAFWLNCATKTRENSVHLSISEADGAVAVSASVYTWNIVVKIDTIRGQKWYKKGKVEMELKTSPQHRHTYTHNTYEVRMRMQSVEWENWKI